MGPNWECPPETLANGRVVYRCNYGHMHSNTTSAWSCDGPASSGASAPCPCGLALVTDEHDCTHRHGTAP